MMEAEESMPAHTPFPISKEHNVIKLRNYCISGLYSSSSGIPYRIHFRSWIYFWSDGGKAIS
jgi:hypothetical protein